MNVLKEKNSSHFPSFPSILTREVSPTISGRTETGPRQSTRGPRALKWGRMYIIWVYIMAWYSRFLIYCFIEDGIEPKATIHQEWGLHCFGFWRLQGIRKQKDDWKSVGFHLYCDSYGWVVVWRWEEDQKCNNQLDTIQKYFWCFVKNALEADIMTGRLVGRHIRLSLHPYGCNGPNDTCGSQWGWVELRWRPFSCQHFMNKHSAHHFCSFQTPQEYHHAQTRTNQPYGSWRSRQYMICPCNWYGLSKKWSRKVKH